MRPKTPTAGKRVFLERIKFIWNRLGFICNSYSREIIMVLVPTILIGIENWSTAIIILATGFIMMAVSGLKLHKVLLALGILVLIVIGAIKLGAVEKIQDLNLFEGNPEEYAISKIIAYTEKVRKTDEQIETIKKKGKQLEDKIVGRWFAR